MPVSRLGGLLLLAACLAAGVACTNSGLGLEDTSRDTDTTTEPTGCPYVGTWTLSQASCGSFLIADWPSVYTSASMEVVDTGEGVCSVAFSWSGASCTETEAWSFDSAAPVECDGVIAEDDPTACYSLTAQGIATCDPAACTFDVSNDAPCAPGDRATTSTIQIDPSVEGVLEVEGLLATAWPTCSLTIVTQWATQ